jgi:hypothetical protein
MVVESRYSVTSMVMSYERLYERCLAGTLAADDGGGGKEILAG